MTVPRSAPGLISTPTAERPSPPRSSLRRQIETRLRTWASDPSLLVVLVAAVVSAAYWSQLTIARFDALRADVFDLGIYFQTSWQVTHGPFTAAQLWGTFATQGITYVVFPLTWAGSYPLLLVVQSVALASAALPLYGIASRILHDRWVAAGMGIAYLLYFPVAGINWFDVHPEMYFIPLFLWGYYAHVANHPRWAYPLLALAGLCRFPFAVYPAGFALLRLAEQRWPSLSLGPNLSPVYPRRYDRALLAVSLGILAVSVPYFLANATSVGGFLHTGSGGTAVPFDDRVLALLLLIAPFLFLPLFAPRWAILLVPAVGLLLVSPDPYYAYPSLFFTQYTATIIPFLFLGFIEGLRRLFPDHPPRGLFAPAAASADATVVPPPAGWRHYVRRRRRAVGALSFLIVLGLALVYQPWGPWNPEVQASYNLPYYTTANTTLSATLADVLGLIPASAGNLLVQDDMPQAFPRPIGNNGTVLIPGETMAYNFTYLYHNAWAPAHIDYVVMDAYSDTFTHAGSFPYNISMATAFAELYESRSYGLVAEAHGILLLERGYQGSLRLYAPQTLQLPASVLSVTAATYRDGPWIQAVNVTNHTTVWYGPYDFVQPGEYAITYSLWSSTAIPTNLLKLEVLDEPSGTLLNSTPVAGTALAPAGTWFNLTVLTDIDSVFASLNLPANDVDWAGTLRLAGISLTEVAPAPVVFVVGSTPLDQTVYRLLHLVPSSATLLLQPGAAPYAAGRPYWLSTTYDPARTAAPNFVLAVPGLGGFVAERPGTNQSDASLAAAYLANASYRLVALVAGVFLLSDVPGQTLTVYSGENLTVPAIDLSTTLPTYRAGATIVARNVTNQSTIWFGPYDYLGPGRYAISYEIRTNDAAPGNFLKLDLLDATTGALLGSLRLTGTVLAAGGAWTNVTEYLNLTEFCPSINLPGNDVDWAGELDLAQITVTQLAPPAP